MQKENKEEPVDADIAININTPEETFLSKNSKLDVDKSEAVATCANIGAVADSCGELNQSLEVPCIESPIRDEWLVLLLFDDRACFSLC